MKRLFVLFVMLFTVFSAAAQEAEVALDTSFNAVTSFFIPAVLSSLLVLWTDTVKHIKAGNYDISIALSTKIVPFLLTQVIAVAIYFLLAYLPFTQPFIEELAGQELGSISAAGLVGMASAIVDGLYKTYKEPTASL